MRDLVISGEKLGKKYRIGQRESYRARRDVLTDFIAAHLKIEFRFSQFPLRKS